MSKLTYAAIAARGLEQDELRNSSDSPDKSKTESKTESNGNQEETETGTETGVNSDTETGWVTIGPNGEEIRQITRVYDYDHDFPTKVEIRSEDGRNLEQIKADLKALHMSEVSGEEFNRIKGSLRLWRFTEKTERHRSVQYQTGLNVDPIKFNPSRTCSAGGLYFCDETQVVTMLNYFHLEFAREVTLLPDSRVWVEGNKYKTDKFVLGPRYFLYDSDFFQDNALELVKNGWGVIYFSSRPSGVRRRRKIRKSDPIVTKHKQTRWKATNPSEFLNRVYFTSVTREMLEHFAPTLPKISVSNLKDTKTIRNGIEFMYYCLNMSDVFPNFSRLSRNDLTYNAALRMIDANWKTIVFVPLEYMDDDMCNFALSKNGRAIRYMEQNPRRCKKAVKQAPLSLEYVEEQYKSESLCYYAVRRNIDTFRFMRNPSHRILAYVSRLTPHVIPTEMIDAGLARQMVRSNPLVLRRFPSHIKTPEFLLECLEKNPKTFGGMNDSEKTEEICFTALLLGASLRDVPSSIRTTKFMKDIIRARPQVLKDVKNVADRPLFLYGLSLDPMNLEHRHHWNELTESEYLDALRRNPKSVQFMTYVKWTDKMHEVALEGAPTEYVKHLHNAKPPTHLIDRILQIDPHSANKIDPNLLTFEQIREASGRDLRVINAVIHKIKQEGDEFWSLADQILTDSPQVLQYMAGKYLTSCKSNLIKKTLRADPSLVRHIQNPYMRTKMEKYLKDLTTQTDE